MLGVARRPRLFSLERLQVTSDARSDPTFSRCQISRGRGLPVGQHDGCGICFRRTSRRSRAPRERGGARRDRTDDLLLAKQALSQLSYGPARYQRPGISNQVSAISSQQSASTLISDCRHPMTDAWDWWAWEDLNFRPHAYQARALTN
jgi:hypothetical protein